MKIGFLHKAMILFLLSIVVLFIATTPAQKELRMDRLDFKVLESDALYFRNLRQYFYAKKTRDDANYDLFYLKSNGNESSRNVANFTIVSNWLNDMAYIMLTVDSTMIIPERLVIAVNSDTVNISSMNMEEHQRLASMVYISLAQDGGRYYLLDDKSSILEIWKGQEERKKVKRVLTDYFKLVGAL